MVSDTDMSAYLTSPINAIPGALRLVQFRSEMAHKTTYLILLLVLGLIIPLFWASPALAQSPEYLFLFIF